MITYAGEPLITDRPSALLSDWLERFMPLCDLSLWGVVPESYRTYRHQGGADRPAVNIGLGRMNFPPRWTPRMNTLYWPSGATRWAQFVGIVDEDRLNNILDFIESDQSRNQPAQLTMCDDRFDVSMLQKNSFSQDGANLAALSTEMYCLQPRMIQEGVGGRGGIFLLPLVDERYHWQFRYADPLDTFDNVPPGPPTDSSLWEDLIDNIGELVDIGGVNRSAIPDGYQGPDAAYWNFNWTLGTYLEALACALGFRVVRSIDRTVSLDSWDDSWNTYQDDLDGNWSAIAGGENNDLHPDGVTAGNVDVVFTSHPEDFLYQQTGDQQGIEIYEHTAEDSGATGDQNANKQYFTTAHTKDEDEAKSFSQAIADAYYGWQGVSYDFVFGGIKNWQQSGFDDAVEWRLDFMPSGFEPRQRRKQPVYNFFTRVQSLPPNCGYTDIPQMLDWSAPSDIEVQLTDTLQSQGHCKGKVVGPQSKNGNMPDESAPNRTITVWDGMGLCSPLKSGTYVLARAWPLVMPGPFCRDWGYLAYAAKCECGSS